MYHEDTYARMAVSVYGFSYHNGYGYYDWKTGKTVPPETTESYPTTRSSNGMCYKELHTVTCGIFLGMLSMYDVRMLADCEDGEVRLADGTHYTNGRVEICISGIWSSVCSDSDWDVVDASVVCTQLGFKCKS